MKDLKYFYSCIDPFDIFKRWYQDIQRSNLTEPTAMTLVTSNKKGVPSARVVLLKDTSESGFTFYTNYQSQKSKDMQENPHVALLFYSDFLQRQIRVKGRAAKVPFEQSDRYFASRSYGSQIGAWASWQSQEMTSREELESRIQEFQKKYPQVVPRPPHWGGFQVQPYYLEFWRGEKHRLNHRIAFVLDEEKSTEDKKIWQKKILSP